MAATGLLYLAILTAFDHDLGGALMHEMREQGIKTHLHSVTKSLEKVDGGIEVAIAAFADVVGATGRGIL